MARTAADKREKNDADEEASAPAATRCGRACGDQYAMVTAPTVIMTHGTIMSCAWNMNLYSNLDFYTTSFVM